ncbi:MAG: hypothetical protein K6E20_00850 [Acholeplasmatales bacterium]|nr:hypothetical protein [Acholeplasmatales bacterium]
MKEEIEKIDKLIDDMQMLMKYIYKQINSYDNKVVFSAMIIKKTIDILTTSKYVFRNYLVSVQISLLRLLCDNCLALESVNQLGLDKVMELINSHQQVNQIMIDEEQNMSDGYLKRKVADKYQAFDKIYRFACEGVHFSKQAISLAFENGENGSRINVNPGNKELKDKMVVINNNIIVVSNIIGSMLKEIVL